MREVQGKAKTVRELLQGTKYSIDYYQREYKWEQKQIRELIDDLTDAFLEDYRDGHPRERVGDYGRYFLGSIIVSEKQGTSYIVDGQQRLTSLTLLLIFLRNLQGKDGPENDVDVDELIFSKKYGKKSFNLDVPERTPCMEALFDQKPYDETDRTESIQNIVARYRDIEEHFGDALKEKSLPYFVDWLIENVHLVEITAFSDDDAYTIFETMNDRGLSLSPTDMLKGYVLANIVDEGRRTTANDRWKERVRLLEDVGKEVSADFFKAWLRSQHAKRIRERKKGAKPEEFDRIGTEFHRWVRDQSKSLGLNESDDFFRFVDRDLDFYSRQYLRIVGASTQRTLGLEPIRYNAQLGFTLQNMVLLAPLRPEDTDQQAQQKLRLVGRYIDILLAWRQWNYRTISYSGMTYAMFVVIREIRGKTQPDELAATLHKMLSAETETFATTDTLRLHQRNSWFIRSLLARLTDYVEIESGGASRYEEYLAEQTKNRHEIEHIWGDEPETHAEEFPYAGEFSEYRNRIGGLLLLPKKFNASFGKRPYEEKREQYNGQNLLARSLHANCYNLNPGFLQFTERTGLPFQTHEQFHKQDLDARQALYRQIAERVWDPALLLQEAES